MGVLHLNFGLLLPPLKKEDTQMPRIQVIRGEPKEEKKRMVRNGSARRLHTLIVRTGSGQSIMLCCILPPPTYSTTPTQHGPSRSSSSNGGIIIISRAAIADACQLPHRQQQQGGNPATEKRNKKDVKYKFP
jgi:hypothetical protein